MPEKESKKEYLSFMNQLRLLWSRLNKPEKGGRLHPTYGGSHGDKVIGKQTPKKR